MSKPIILEVECIVCNELLQKINHNPEQIPRKMGKITNRRSRTPNWSIEEKQHLLELIKPHRVVITKTTNGPNYYEEKDVAWNAVLRGMAARFGEKFNVSSIKKVKTQWQNMKRIAREEISVYGYEINKYTRQSFEVCNILGIVKDGVLVRTETENTEINPNLNGTASAATPAMQLLRSNIEIKTERMDEDPLDPNQPSCSTNNTDKTTDNNCTQINSVESESSCSYSDQNSETQDESQDQERSQVFEESVVQEKSKDVSSNTETSLMGDLNPLHKNFQQFMSFSSTERQLKLETMKEERHIVRAIRETAELNKIIAEQRLKHVLWIKKKEMA